MRMNDTLLYKSILVNYFLSGTKRDERFGTREYTGR